MREARIAALETDYDDEEEHGLSDDFILGALKDSSNLIHLYLVNEKKEPFAAYKDIDVANVESVAVPTNIFSDNLIYQVWFSANGLAGTFNIELESMYQRYNPLLSGTPEYYMVDGGYIYLDRKPTSGYIRTRYERLIDEPDLRRGQVLSTTGTLPALTTITIDTTETVFYKESYWATTPEYISINDRDGNVLMRNIPVESYDSSTGVITLDTFSADTGETCPAESWVCFGGNSTTHIKLPSISKTFFKEYVKTIAFEGRSEDDIATSNPRMATFLEQIAEVYAQLPSGFNGIPTRRGY